MYARLDNRIVAKNLDIPVSPKSSRSGGVARFSIAAFASHTMRRPVEHYIGEAYWKASPRAVDRGFKRGWKLLKVPPGAPSLLCLLRRYDRQPAMVG